MERTLEKENNINVISMIPSVTMREHLIKTEIEFTALDQLSIIKSSMLSIQKKKKEYLKYAMDWRKEVYSLALRYLGEIEIIENIINNEEECYQFSLFNKHGECNPVNSMQEIIPMINFFDMSEEKVNTYKINITDKEDEMVAQIWMNNKHEIIMYTIDHIFEELGGIELDTLPYKHLQKVKYIKEMDDDETYLYVDLEEEKLGKRGFLDAVPIVKESLFMQKHSKLGLMNNIKLVSNLVIE